MQFVARTRRQTENRAAPSGFSAAGIWLLATLGCATALQSVLLSPTLHRVFLSDGLWRELLAFLGGRVPTSLAGTATVELDWLPLAIWNIAAGLVWWFGGAVIIARRQLTAYTTALARWGRYGWAWGLLPVAWEALRIFAFILQLDAFLALLEGTILYWLAFAGAGWVMTFFSLCQKNSSAVNACLAPPTERKFPRVPWPVWLGVLLYIVVFTAMNWGLWFNLQIPHGDSAMYEEHLWNITHGKGFRSYLDKNLFLGEHIQVIHLLLLPEYLLWPSHLLLELAESTALALGALPVFWLTLRLSGSRRAAILLALAYLLYAPLQFLDIAIDGKTFRPTAFGAVALLFALAAIEARAFKRAAVCILLTWAAKEEYAIVTAPIGVWLACTAWRESPGDSAEHARDRGYRMKWGIGLAVVSTAYLALALKVLIPYFRGGEVHYVGYFQEFGGSLNEIITTMLRQPGLLLTKWFSAESLRFTLLLLLPLGGLALRSPGRLLTAAPLFGLLCLSKLTRTSAVMHHFHAPLLPIVFWAAAAGLARKQTAQTSAVEAQNSAANRAMFALGCAFFTGLFLTRSPLSVSFWDAYVEDPQADRYWKSQYLPGERAKQFAKVQAAIPPSARVFSTDFVHPRFTHYARSYDYSDFARDSDAELTQPLPGETYYIVIDVQHRYSQIKSPQDVPAFRDHPDDWELLNLDTDGYFIVLRRR